MHACFGLIVVFLLWWRTPLLFFFGAHMSKFLLIITESHIGIAGSYYNRHAFNNTEQIRFQSTVELNYFVFSLYSLV